MVMKGVLKFAQKHHILFEEEVLTQFPTGIAHLTSSLANVNGNDFSHLRRHFYSNEKNTFFLKNTFLFFVSVNHQVCIFQLRLNSSVCNVFLALPTNHGYMKVVMAQILFFSNR